MSDRDAPREAAPDPAPPRWYRLYLALVVELGVLVGIFHALTWWAS